MSETPNTYITLKEEAKSRDNLQDLIQPQQEEYHKNPRPIHPGNKDDLEKVTNIPRHTPMRLQTYHQTLKEAAP